MGKSNLTGQHIIFGFIFLTGAIFFLWFCWPMLFKGIFNTGNACGMAGSLLFMFYGIRHHAIQRILVQLWAQKTTRICLIMACILAFIAAMLIVAAVTAIVRADSDHIPGNTPAIVLGCSVKGSRPSRVLQERIDAAFAYLQKHPQALCVLSGGQGKGEDISEAECMYRELVQMGIDDSRLYKEEASTNTQENLEYSEEILTDLGMNGAITIISNEFHLYRGRYWASELGYDNYGFAAHTDWRYFPTFFLREVIAVVHLWLT